MMDFRNLRTGSRAVNVGASVGHLGTGRPGPHRRHWIIRPDDLLVIDVATENLKVVPADGDGKAELVRAGPGPAYLIVTLPPQHLTEEAYFSTVPEYPLTPKPPPPGEQETQPLDDDAELEQKLKHEGGEKPKDPPIPAYLADWSTLSFIVRDKNLPIKWSLEAILLAIPHLELSVAPNALPNRDPPPLFSPFVDAIGAVDITTATIASAVTGGGGARPAGAATAGMDALVEESAGARRVSSLGKARDRSRIRTIGHALGISNATGSDTIGLFEPGAATTVNLADLFLRPAPRPPTSRETAIELPHRLILSPNQHAAWFHSERAVRSDVSGHTELWHTRLGVRQPGGRLVDGPDPLRTVRAIWTKDPDPPVTPAKGDDVWTPDPYPSNGDLFRASLDAADRHNIVHLSSNFQLRRPLDQDAFFEPQAVTVDNLALSALGGWLDARGVWDEQPLRLEVEEWRHRATLGRDHYVRVVYAGRLFPLGHRASLVKVTERRFDTTKTGHPAYQRQMMFLVIREPLRTYGASGLTYKGPDLGRAGEKWDFKFPFTAARILNRVSPLLDKPEDTEVELGYNRRLFWPYVKKQPFCFHVIATDMVGQPIDLEMPLVFIGQSEGDKNQTDDTNEPTSLVPTSVVQQYGSRTWPNSSQLLATIPLGGQKVAFAPSVDPDDTTFAVESLTFAGEVPIAKDFNAIHPRLKPRYVPVICEANLSVPALQLIAQTDHPATLTYDKTYLRDGFGGANKGEVFLAAKQGATVDLTFSSRANRSGGLVAPDMRLGGLSRITGPVGGAIDSAVSGTFKPSDWFGVLADDALLFGALKLTHILGESPFAKLDELPRLVGDSLNEVQRVIAELERLKRLLDADALPAASYARNLLAQLTEPDTGQYAGLLDSTTKPAQVVSALDDIGHALTDLKPTLESGLTSGPWAVIEEAIDSVLSALGVIDFGLLDRIAKGDLLPETFAARFDWRPVLTPTPIFKPKGNRNLILSVEASGDELIVTCSLDSFDLDLTYLILKFKRVQYRVRAGKKPEIDVDFNEFVFGGPLSFIETLRDLIPLEGFADPPDVDVTPEGITAGFSTALPNIAVGVFSLENLSLAAGFSVPFVGPPMTTWFRFCERENPARLTVSLFGGGFFFGVTVDASGLQVVEGAIEFGAAVSVNFGVASGSVSAMAGLYFSIEGSKVTLAGYFRLRGEVEALGVVSVSIELYLEMRYEDGGGASGKCVGTATISVEVEVALWSTTIKLTCTKKFAGSGEGADPTLAETLHLTSDMTSSDWTEYCEAFAA